MASIEMANLCLNPENEIRSDEDWRKKNPRFNLNYYFISFRKNLIQFKKIAKNTIHQK
jgi:hypothetical protein